MTGTVQPTPAAPAPIVYADLALARRIEATEAAVGMGWCQALARSGAVKGAASEPFAGGYAVFAGPGSPGTHALGIGVNGPISAEELDAMEEFFRSRGSDSLIDLCPLAGLDLLQHLMARGYVPIEFNNIMARLLQPNEPDPEPPLSAVIRVPQAGEKLLWARAVVQGFSGFLEAPEEFVDSAAALCDMPDGVPLQIDIEGVPAATAGMAVKGDVAALFGDSTLTAYRARGLQKLLIQDRLAQAARTACTLAYAAVLPGSSSQRNYERMAFRVVYTRCNLRRKLT